jgi:hypothetical protein
MTAGRESRRLLLAHRAGAAAWTAAGLTWPSIHDIINARSGNKPQAGGVNAVSLVKLRRRNARFILDVLAPSDWDRVNFAPRYWTLQRWHRRYLRALKRSPAPALSACRGTWKTGATLMLKPGVHNAGRADL